MKNIFSPSSNDLSRALSEENRILEERETQRRASKMGVEYVNMQGFPLDLNVLSMFSEEEARQSGALPFYRELHDVRIGMTDPENPLLKEKLAELSRKFKLKTYLISHSSFNDTVRFYSKVLRPKATFVHEVKVDPDKSYVTQLKKWNDDPLVTEVTASEMLMTIMGSSLQLGASDVHIEPEEHIVKIRFRIDGVLQDMVHLVKEEQRALTTRVKLMSKLKLNVENLPQDGRFTFTSGEEKIDVRVSVLPSTYGEAIVLRLLGVGATGLGLDQLGLAGKAYEVIKRELDKPNGMIVTTGPTGSGKTTTLYAFLNYLNEPGVKIITLEDPVEYKLSGIQQTPIDHHVDFNFAKGLRAILRQDPDIVMVGEIRDGETADTALQAALTGHIVLSTLHTNDAIGAVPRLLVMGVKPFVIAPALNAVIAQRLVRRLCPHCRTETEVPEELLGRVRPLLAEIPASAKMNVPDKLVFFRSSGCDRCHHLGYQGRIGVYEVMEINDTVRGMITKGASATEMKKQAKTDGMISMVQDGLIKALQGVTDLEEVFRVTGE